MICAVVSAVQSQTVFSPEELEAFLQKAEKASAQYSETFKNLSAEETKTYDGFARDGRIKGTRRIKSTFIVYQLTKSEQPSEFRSVTEFNGKTVARTDGEIEKFFAKLANSGSAAEERKRVVKEATRFDGSSYAWGITLWQDNPFGMFRPFFDFKIVGEEQIENRKFFVLEYNQTKPTLLLKVNATDEETKKEPQGKRYNSEVSKVFRPTNGRLSGKIWLDAETAQIWRNEVTVRIHPAQLSRPVTSVELIYEYQPSEFGIYVPKRFLFTHYEISGSNDENLRTAKFRQMLFEYTKFSRFKTETKDYKIARETHD